MIDWGKLAKNVATFVAHNRIASAIHHVMEATDVILKEPDIWLLSHLWDENPEQAARELRMFAYKAQWKGKLTFADVCRFVEQRRVALIGNAESFLSSGYGEDIDSHDVVVRINAGVPHPDLAKDFGQRIDVWGGVNSGRVAKRMHIEDPTGVLLETMVHLGEWGERVKQVWFVPWGPRQITDDIAPKTYGLFDDWFLARNYKGSNPSSGFVLAAMLTRTGAAEINLYGFDFFKSPSLQSGSHPREPVKQAAEKRWLLDQPRVLIYPAARTRSPQDLRTEGK